MTLRRTSAVGARPVGLAWAKEHLRVTHTEEDGLIGAIIAAACDQVGEMSGRVLAEETWAFSQPYFSGVVMLPKSPVIAVTSITYVDTNGATQTASTADFNLFLNDDYSQIGPKTGKVWPTADTSRPDGVTITFTAGYTDLPDSLHMAILLLIGHYYSNREAVGAAQSALPLGVEFAVGMHRLGWAAA